MLVVKHSDKTEDYKEPRRKKEPRRQNLSTTFPQRGARDLLIILSTHPHAQGFGPTRNQAPYPGLAAFSSLLTKQN